MGLTIHFSGNAQGSDAPARDLISAFRATILLWGMLLAPLVHGQEMRPDFGKLAALQVCPAGVEFARTNDIPIEGIDPVTEADHLSPGDSITALIVLFETHRHESQWLLRIRAEEPTPDEKRRAAKPPLVLYAGVGEKMEFTQSLAPASLRLAGPFSPASGRNKVRKVQDETTRISVNQGFLGLGLDQAAAATHRIVQNHLHGQFTIRSRPFTAAQIAESQKTTAALQLSLKEQRAIAGSSLALDSYVRIVQETPGLDEIFYQVVKPPSIWSIVSHLGAKVSLNLETKYVAPTKTATWNLAPETPCYTFPLALRVNNQPALITTLVVAPPRAPFLESAGIVGMLAENPKDKETYLLLRIVSARHRAAEGQAAQFP